MQGDPLTRRVCFIAHVFTYVLKVEHVDGNKMQRSAVGCSMWLTQKVGGGCMKTANKFVEAFDSFNCLEAVGFDDAVVPPVDPMEIGA